MNTDKAREAAEEWVMQNFTDSADMNDIEALEYVELAGTAQDAYYQGYLAAMQANEGDAVKFLDWIIEHRYIKACIEPNKDKYVWCRQRKVD